MTNTVVEPQFSLQKMLERTKITATCWLWQGCVNKDGYGNMSRRVNGKLFNKRVHRLAYESFVGPIPSGLVLDHLCRNRGCVNPKHLEPVTNAENTRRGLNGVLKTHCIRGHEYTEDNTYYRRTPYGSGTQRGCKVCRRQAVVRSRILKKGQSNAITKSK